MPFLLAGRARLRRFVIRHRVSIQDLFLVLVSGAVTGLILYQVDVFANTPQRVENAIEIDEIPILAIVLCLGLLIFALRRAKEQKREARHRIAAEQRARELAMQDPLTGLPNRRQFADALNTAIAAPPGTGATHALFILDLNRFKQVNDVFGHGAGDEVLIEVGTRLLAAMHSGDLVARLGGDEFAILAHHLAGAEAATGIALRAIETFAAPFATGGVTHYLGVAIGIAVFPFPGSTGEEIMRRADVALYKAKSGDKSSLRFFDEEMDRRVRERERLERVLRSAIPGGEIEPFFQPLVDLKTRGVVGFEVVPHWNHKELGVIAPARFMSIAEDSGLIRDLADRLLRRACQVARGWPRDVVLAFNVSPVLLKDPTFGLRVLGILGETGLPTGQLEIEIAENALVRDLETAKAVLGPLRGAGVQIVLDDFGTGYTSLYHLRNFKVDKIKIAGSFVARMGAERESAEIVNALIGLGRGLGFTVTADGVDGTAEGDELSAHGCAQGQGTLFGDAIPAAETAACFAEAREVGAAG